MFVSSVDSLSDTTARDAFVTSEIGFLPTNYISGEFNGCQLIMIPKLISDQFVFRTALQICLGLGTVSSETTTPNMSYLGRAHSCKILFIGSLGSGNLK